MDDLHVVKGTATAGIRGYSKKGFSQEGKQEKRSENRYRLFE